MQKLYYYEGHAKVGDKTISCSRGYDTIKELFCDFRKYINEDIETDEYDSYNFYIMYFHGKDHSKNKSRLEIRYDEFIEEFKLFDTGVGWIKLANVDKYED